MTLLEQVYTPTDIRHFSLAELRQLAGELRHFIINEVATKEGHLGAGLGVVELTIALHYVFNTPEDILVFDVGHQAYPHKLLQAGGNALLPIDNGGGFQASLSAKRVNTTPLVQAMRVPLFRQYWAWLPRQCFRRISNASMWLS